MATTAETAARENQRVRREKRDDLPDLVEQRFVTKFRLEHLDWQFFYQKPIN
jgi:hypothetical protein